MHSLLPSERKFTYIGDQKVHLTKGWKIFHLRQLAETFEKRRYNKKLAKREKELAIAIARRVRKSAQITDEEVRNLGAEINQEPIHFEATEKHGTETPAEEIGYGENTDELPNEHEAIMEIVDSKLSKIQGLTEFQLDILRHIYLEFIDAFGIEQSMCRMSLLDPIEVVLKEGHDIPFCTGRNLGQEQREFLEKKLHDLMLIGIIKEAANAYYGSPIFIVPKKGPKKWRMVVDMRNLNKISVKTAMQMPLLEDQLKDVSGAKIFGSFDVLSGFDFLPTHENSQKYFTLVSSDAAYTMCGAPMGWLNTPALFQDRIVRNVLRPNNLYRKERNGAIQWLDDTLLYAEDFESYCKNLRKFLQGMIDRKVRLSIEKCELYGSEVEWCGRKISAEGWNYATKFYEKILLTQPPVRAWELAQVIYLCNWIGPAIPNLSKLRDKFSSFTDGTKMKKMKKENKLVIWTPELTGAWEALLETIKESSEKFLRTYDPFQEMLLFTDASDSYWSLVVMQDHPDNVREATQDGKVDIYRLKPKPIMFLSGKFNNSQLQWHISHKELYPIVHASLRVARVDCY